MPTPVATSSAARPAAAHLKDGAFYSQAPGRAVGGLSMGGFATLHLAFNYPHLFDTVGVHSSSLRTAEEVPDFLDGERAFAQVGPLALAATIDWADAPRLWLDIGEWDTWAQRALALRDLLRARGIPHGYHVPPGGHDAGHWTTHVAHYLHFYTTALSSH